MTLSDPKREFLTSLLLNDEGVSAAKFEEYRAMLTKKMTMAERQFVFRRRATAGLWMGVAALVLSGFVLPLLGPTWKPVAMSFFVLAYGLGLLGVLRLIMFVFVDRYRFERVRNELRDATLLELTRKVDRLSEQFLQTPPRA